MPTPIEYRSLIDDESEVIRVHKALRRPDVFVDRRHETIRLESKKSSTVTTRIDVWLPALEGERTTDGVVSCEEGWHVIPIGMFKRRRTAMDVRVGGSQAGLLGRSARNQLLTDLQLWSAKDELLRRSKKASAPEAIKGQHAIDVASGLLDALRPYVAEVVGSPPSRFAEALDQLEDLISSSKRVFGEGVTPVTELVGTKLIENLKLLEEVNHLFVVARAPIGVPIRVEVTNHEENDSRSLSKDAKKSGFSAIGLADTQLQRSATNAGHVESYMVSIESAGSHRISAFWASDHDGQIPMTEWDGPVPTLGWRAMDGLGRAIAPSARDQHPPAEKLEMWVALRTERTGNNLRGLLFGLLALAAFVIAATTTVDDGNGTARAIVIPSFIASPTLAIGYLFALRSHIERWTSAAVEVLAFLLALCGGLVGLLALTDQTQALQRVAAGGALVAWLLVGVTAHTLVAPRPLQNSRANADWAKAERAESLWAAFTSIVIVLVAYFLFKWVWS